MTPKGAPAGAAAAEAAREAAQDAAKEAEKAIRRTVKKTREAMEELGTYRPQFDPAIRMYAEMRQQLGALNAEFYALGCPVTEMYTNKAGATNERKTALYCTIETLRRDVAAMEDRLGLSPSGMRRINEAEMKARKKESKLSAALEKLGR